MRVTLFLLIRAGIDNHPPYTVTLRYVVCVFNHQCVGFPNQSHCPHSVGAGIPPPIQLCVKTTDSLPRLGFMLPYGPKGPTHFYPTQH